MFPNLLSAPTHVSLFIRRITMEALADALSQLGIEEGTQIRKLDESFPLDQISAQTLLGGNVTFSCGLQGSVFFKTPKTEQSLPFREIRKEVQFKHLFPVKNERDEDIIVVQSKENELRVCVTTKMAEQIWLGICEICWSCGECNSL